MKNSKIEQLVKKHTAFESMDAMINASGNYRPSLRTKTGRNAVEKDELTQIAQEYNRLQEERGDSRRAFES